jgi:four helix bundle protein
MTNKEFAKKLENRTIKFAIEIINLSSSLPKTQEALVLRNQISKSGTSIGANYREVNRSRSKKDFKNKIEGFKNRGKRITGSFYFNSK